MARLFNMEARDYKRFLNFCASTIVKFRSRNTADHWGGPATRAGHAPFSLS